MCRFVKSLRVDYLQKGFLKVVDHDLYLRKIGRFSNIHHPPNVYIYTCIYSHFLLSFLFPVCISFSLLKIK